MSDRTPEDALDAALNRLPNSSVGAPEWLMPIDARLRELDAAFARRTERGEVANLVHLSLSGQDAPAPIGIWDIPPRGWVSRRLRVASFAAVLALMLFGTLALAGNPGDWFDGDGRPFGASIPAAGTPASQPVFEAMVVTPSSCTIPPLTRERYDQAMIGKTPVASSELSTHIRDQNEAMMILLEPQELGGEVVVTGGSPVPMGTSSEISAALAGFIACLNQGDEARLNGFLSEAFMPWISDPDSEFAEMQATGEPEGGTVKLLQIRQMRLLEDGRVAAVVTFELDEPTVGVTPYPTPAGTVAIDGHVFVLVKTADGWRLDYSNTGEVFRLPLPEGNAGSPVVSTPVPTVAPIVVTPGACTLPVMTKDEFDQIIGATSGTPVASPVVISDDGVNQAAEQLGASYVRLLTHELQDGKIVFTTGRPASQEDAEGIAQLMSSFYGCLVTESPSTWPSVFSPDYLRILGPELEYPDKAEGTPISNEAIEVVRWELDQIRELPDGRVMAVVTPLMTTEEMVTIFGFEPMATPTNSVAPTGVITIFVNSGGSWQIDFQMGPEAFRMPLVTVEATPAVP